ncbi:MAG: glycosyltransferase [Pseudomonadota bacterium]
MTARVSVVVPTHNRRHTLEAALDSVAAQTHTPHETIVVDDGSDDGTTAWLRAKRPKVITVQQANRGVSAARNRGIALATGDWIALLDSDDAWQPTKLAVQLAALRTAPDHRLCHTDEIWIRNGVRVNPKRRHAKHGGHIFRHCLPLCAISPSAALIHRSVFDDIGPFDEALPACEDYDYWLRLCSREPVLYVDQQLVIKSGGHADQLSRRYEAMDRFRIHALLNLLERAPLSSGDRAAALETLDAKLRVYGDGARKRGNTGELDAALHRRSTLPAGPPPC